MTSRERFLACMRYQPVDRAPFRGTLGVWPETLERWRREGCDEPGAPAFEMDHWEWIGHWFFPHPPFEREVVDEDDQIVLYVNKEGILMREFKNHPFSTMPQFVRFPVATREDFRRFWRERMRPDLSARIGPDWQTKLAAYRQRDCPLFIKADRWGGFFGPLRNLVGVKNLALLFYDDPAFLEEMMDATADFIIAMMDQILDCTDVDVFGFWEDMAFKTSSLLSPAMARRYMLPRYRRVIDFLRGRGVEFICVDSDGNISDLIPVWLDAGVNVLYPFEVQAGMDVCQVRKEYGEKLRMWFGLDKRAVAAGPAAVDAELARVSPLIQEGGYVPGVDHGLPPDVSFPNYCYYMEKLEAALEGR